MEQAVLSGREKSRPKHGADGAVAVDEAAGLLPAIEGGLRIGGECGVRREQLVVRGDGIGWHYFFFRRLRGSRTIPRATA